jgi:hypothetical protein
VVLQHGEQVLQRGEQVPQCGEQVVWSAHFLAVIQIAEIFITLLRYSIMRRLLEVNRRIPYHTSILSGAGWLDELLTGHLEHIWTELGVYRGTFALLVKALDKCEVRSSRHVSVEEQLAIFLYTVGTGLPCTNVGERFQQSSSTITK